MSSYHNSRLEVASLIVAVAAVLLMIRSLRVWSRSERRLRFNLSDLVLWFLDYPALWIPALFGTLIGLGLIFGDLGLKHWIYPESGVERFVSAALWMMLLIEGLLLSYLRDHSSFESQQRPRERLIHVVIRTSMAIHSRHVWERLRDRLLGTSEHANDAGLRYLDPERPAPAEQETPGAAGVEPVPDTASGEAGAEPAAVTVLPLVRIKSAAEAALRDQPLRRLRSAAAVVVVQGTILMVLTAFVVFLLVLVDNGNGLLHAMTWTRILVHWLAFAAGLIAGNIIGCAGAVALTYGLPGSKPLSDEERSLNRQERAITLSSDGIGAVVPPLIVIGLYLLAMALWPGTQPWVLPLVIVLIALEWLRTGLSALRQDNRSPRWRAFPWELRRFLLEQIGPMQVSNLAAILKEWLPGRHPWIYAAGLLVLGGVPGMILGVVGGTGISDRKLTVVSFVGWLFALLWTIAFLIRTRLRAPNSAVIGVPPRSCWPTAAWASCTSSPWRPTPPRSSGRSRTWSRYR
jgi:hypothetical protein